MTRGFSRSIWMFMIRKVRKNLPWSLVLHTCRTQAIALHTSANTRLICRPHRRGRLHQKMIIRLRQRTASHGVAAGHGVAAPPVAMSKPRMSLMTTRWTPLVLLPKQRTQSPLATWGAVKRRCTIFLVKLKTAPTTTARQKVRVSPARPPRLLFTRSKTDLQKKKNSNGSVISPRTKILEKIARQALSGKQLVAGPSEIVEYPCLFPGPAKGKGFICINEDTRMPLMKYMSSAKAAHAFFLD